MITITGGHGDFRQLSDLPRTIGGLLSRLETTRQILILRHPQNRSAQFAAHPKVWVIDFSHNLRSTEHLISHRICSGPLGPSALGLFGIGVGAPHLADKVNAA
jgi:hypothetical protein